MCVTFGTAPPRSWSAPLRLGARVRSSLSCFVIAVSAACNSVSGDPAQNGDSDHTPGGDTDIPFDTNYGEIPSNPGTDEDPWGVDPGQIFGFDARPEQTTCLPFTAPPAPAGYQFNDRFPLLHTSAATAFSFPTGMFQRPGDNTRFYVTERYGKIKMFLNDPTVTEADVVTVLDLTATTSGNSDCSLSAIAFPPDFTTSRVAYVSYCYTPDRTAPGSYPNVPHVQVRVSRFKLFPTGETFDPASEQVILAANYRNAVETYTYKTATYPDGPDADSEVDVFPARTQECSGNNMPPGTIGLHGVDVMRFAPDGMLYLTIGDGGPQNVCGGLSAQDLTSLRGKMLRMDVSDLTKQLPTEPFALDQWVYGAQYIAVDAPADNPFVTFEQQLGVVKTHAGDDITAVNPIAQLIYAYGFRNPWQWHIERKAGNDFEIWVGDVGNGSYEEVDRHIVKGGNYGWGLFEGFQCANNWSATQCRVFRDHHAARYPALEYPHLGGSAITGGLVYRGTRAPAYTGAYFFGDYSRQRIWAVKNADNLPDTPQECTSSASCSAGFVCKRNGRACDPVAPVCSAPGFVACDANSKCAHDTSLSCILPTCFDGSTCDPLTKLCADGESCYDRGGSSCATAIGQGLSFCQPTFEVVARPQSGGVLQISAFSQDEVTGDLYAILLNKDFQGSKITRFEPVPVPPSTDGGPPPLLSQTGCFAPGNITQPVADLVPFVPHAQLWSDGATKRRWFTLPNDASVVLADDGDFLWPSGSMLVKEFALGNKIVETRFLVKQIEDGRWAGYSYAWNTAQTDAQLVVDRGADVSWTFATADDPDVSQVWHYPGRGQCFYCHSDIANTSLGLETAQLNHSMLYPQTTRLANQIDTLVHVGIVDDANAPPPYEDLSYILDATRSIEDRARSYLHANCSGCHRPEGPTFIEMDLRYETAFADMHICNTPPQIADMEEIIPNGPKLLAPGDITRSQIYQRMLTNGKYRMPPVARAIAHTEALAVIEAWINGITVDDCTPP